MRCQHVAEFHVFFFRIWLEGDIKPVFRCLKRLKSSPDTVLDSYPAVCLDNRLSFSGRLFFLRSFPVDRLLGLNCGDYGLMGLWKTFGFVD